MAAVLRRRVATTIASSFPAERSQRAIGVLSTPRFPPAVTSAPTSARLFGALTSPRAPAAATTLGRPSATATASVGSSVPTAAPLRSNHQAAADAEARIQRVEADVIVLKKEIMKMYERYLSEQATQNIRISGLSDTIFAESRRGVIRAAKSSTEHARAIIEVGKTSWRVVVVVVTAGASTAFAVTQLVRTDSKTEQEKLAERVVSAKTEELQKNFGQDLESAVGRAVEVAMAKEARRKAEADELAINAMNRRLEDALAGLEEKITGAMEVAIAKHASKVKTDLEGGNGS